MNEDAKIVRGRSEEKKKKLLSILCDSLLCFRRKRTRLVEEEEGARVRVRPEDVVTVPGALCV